MKLNFLIFMFLIALAIRTPGQIPNSGFENWAIEGNCIQPSGWACINDWMGLTENCYSVSRSDDHYPASVGNYSIKIENTISIWPDWGAAGLVWTGDSTGFGTDQPAFPVTGHPTSLCGYYKFIPQLGDTMFIYFALYKNGIEVTGGGFMENATISEWTSFNIPVSNTDYADVDSARIMMSSFNADNFGILYGNSVLYVDNLSFDNLISGIDEAQMQNILFTFNPNPASDYVMFNFGKTNTENITIEIYNSTGTLVRRIFLNQSQEKLDVTDLCSGIYIVSVKSNNFTGKQKLVIQR